MNDAKKISHIVHFKTRLKCSKKNKLTRDNYCVPTDKISYKNKKNIRITQEFYEKNNRYPLLCPSCYLNIPNEIFRDSEHFTEQFIEKHYRDCMENFDLNMDFFNSLKRDEFNKHLSSFVKRNKFKEIDDLDKVSYVEGVYILVLDAYKQVYIGVSSNIKRRILQHWSRKKSLTICYMEQLRNRYYRSILLVRLILQEFFINLADGMKCIKQKKILYPVLRAYID